MSTHTVPETFDGPLANSGPSCPGPMSRFSTS